MPALIERPKMTCTMYQALKKHILKEREKKKQEQEQDAELERQKKEREIRKKKEEKDSLTLEQTKEQIGTLEKELEKLKGEKHELFSKLKKVLHEDETRKRTQQDKEQSQLVMSGGHPYPQSIPVSAQLNTEGSSPRSSRPSMYKPQQTMMPVAGLKRPRSPSPPPNIYYQQQYGQGDSKYGTGQYMSANPQHGPYSQKGPVVYGGQTGAYQSPGHYQASQSGGKYPTSANQSAFSTYPGHFPQQQIVPGQAAPQHGYQVPRMQQPGFIRGSPHRSLQQHTAMDSPTGKDKYKPPVSQSQLTHQAPLPQRQAMLQHMQINQPQPKGSIMTGYPVRTQATTSSSYPPSTISQTPSIQSSRANFPGQQPSRYM